MPPADHEAESQFEGRAEADAWADQGLAAICSLTVLWLATMDKGVETYRGPIEMMIAPVPWLLVGVFIAHKPARKKYDFGILAKPTIWLVYVARIVAICGFIWFLWRMDVVKVDDRERHVSAGLFGAVAAVACMVVYGAKFHAAVDGGWRRGRTREAFSAKVMRRTDKTVD